MYLQHFALKEYPFTLTPDTEFFFGQGVHQEALNVLLVALQAGEGFIKITGEVGTGKTLVCRRLLNLLDDAFVTAYLPNPFVDPKALQLGLAEELGLACSPQIDSHTLLKTITQRLIELDAAGKRAVLLLDEAQSLPDDTLEALRLLTNLETEKRKLLQVVLFGQPELDQRLAQHQLRQLSQRIAFSYCLAPLDRHSLEGYVRHRLEVAGEGHGVIFSPPFFRLLHRYSRGIPRVANLLCHKAMMLAYGSGATCVTHRHLKTAATDTEAARAHGPLWLTLISGLVGFTATTGVGLISVYML